MANSKTKKGPVLLQNRPVMIMNFLNLVLVRIDQTPVGIKPLGNSPEHLNDELSALRYRISTVGILFNSTSLDLFIETLFESTVIVYILRGKHFTD